VVWYVHIRATAVGESAKVDKLKDYAVRPRRTSDLVAQAIAGDEAALKQLLGTIDTRLAADVSRTVGVENVVLETHLEVFRRISGFKPRGKDAFFRWAATIARGGRFNTHRNSARIAGVSSLTAGHAQ